MTRSLSILEAGCILLVSTLLFIAAAFLMPWLAPGYMTDGGTWHAVTSSIEILCFLLPGAVYALIRRIPPGSLMIRRCTAAQVALSILAALSGYMVMTFLQLVWLTVIQLLGGVPVQTPTPAIDTPFRLLLGLLSIAGSAALAEEFLFRGALLPALASRNRVMALLVSSAIFMLMHGALETLPYTFLYGLLLGWLTLRSGSVWPAVAFHATNNAIPVLLTYAASNIKIPPQLEIGESVDLLSNPAAMAATLALYGLIALLCAACLTAVLWAYKKQTKAIVRFPERREKLWRYIPYFAAGFVMLCLVVLETLQVFGFLTL